MQFDLPKDLSSTIKVIGVGGGGSNAVNHMYKQGIKGVDFIVCNTDQQALDISPVPYKMVLGATLTKGRGAGSMPEVGRNAAIENIEDIKEILGTNTEMVFITAGMGGGTGTGAAPVIAQVAKEMGILTVGIVTLPFSQEGKKRRDQALSGISELRANVDSLIIINNDKLREIYGNLKASQSFAKADDVLSMAARGIADIITTTLQINTDINDVKTVMRDSGVAIMGTASAFGEGRAIKSVEEALSSPLLNDNEIKGARYVLVNITCGTDDNEITMDELGDITDYIQEAAGQSAELIKGYGIDESLGDRVNVTIIATGFNSKEITGGELQSKPEKIVRNLTDEKVSEQPESTASQTNNTENVSSVSEEPASPLEPFLIVRPLEEQPRLTEEIEIEITNITSVNALEVEAEATEEPVIEEQAVEPIAIVEQPVFEQPEPELIKKTEAPEAKDEIAEKIQNEDQIRKAQERIMKLKELSFKLKTPNGLTELENEPAYRRKNIHLEPTPHSSESQVSKYTLSPEEGDDKKVNIRPNNSFLHDNVD